jgi:hypothetical protein
MLPAAAAASITGGGSLGYGVDHRWCKPGLRQIERRRKHRAHTAGVETDDGAGVDEVGHDLG